MWLAVCAVGAGLWLELDYHERMARLPQLVDPTTAAQLADPQDRTAAINRAMAALEKYNRALQVRHYGWASLGFGLILGGLFTFTKNAGSTAKVLHNE